MTSRMKSLYLAACVVLFSQASIGQTVDKGGRQFEVYHSFGFPNMPNDELKKYNVRPIGLYGHAELWAKGDKLPPTEPNIEQVKKIGTTSIKNKDVLVSLDIEYWDPDMDKPAVTQNFVRRFTMVADAFREKAPNTKFGFYAELPQRNFWDPVKKVRKLPNKYDGWQKLNRDLQPIADKVDVIMPSLYTFYKDDVAGWQIYAEENIKEARKYGKPVYVFLWPQYDPDSEAKVGQAPYLGYDTWKLQLETVYKFADGVIIWMPKGTGQRWDGNAPWWKATRDFLEEKKIGQAPSAPGPLKLETR